jgi:hypothetical protein
MTQTIRSDGLVPFKEQKMDPHLLSSIQEIACCVYFHL